MLQWTESELKPLTHQEFNPGRHIGGKFERRKILVLEDDLCLETLLNRVFHAVDPEIETKWITTGDLAIDEIGTHHRDEPSPYSLIVADISTPGNQSGLDFWRVCRLRFPRIPFLFISAMPVDQFLRILGSNTLCPPFLPKPFAVGECRQIVEGLLKYRQEPI